MDRVPFTVPSIGWCPCAAGWCFSAATPALVTIWRIVDTRDDLLRERVLKIRCEQCSEQLRHQLYHRCAYMRAFLRYRDGWIYARQGARTASTKMGTSSGEGPRAPSQWNEKKDAPRVRGFHAPLVMLGTGQQDVPLAISRHAYTDPERCESGRATHLGHVLQERLRAAVSAAEKDADEGFRLMQASFNGIDVALGRAPLARGSEESAFCGDAGEREREGRERRRGRRQGRGAGATGGARAICAREPNKGAPGYWTKKEARETYGCRGGRSCDTGPGGCSARTCTCSCGTGRRPCCSCDGSASPPRHPCRRRPRRTRGPYRRGRRRGGPRGHPRPRRRSRPRARARGGGSGRSRARRGT